MGEDVGADFGEDIAAERRRDWTSRLAALERLINQRGASGRWRQAALVVALALFVVVSVLSFRSLPHGVHFHWWLLAVIVVVVAPLTVVANAAEFRVMGAMNGHAIRWPPALRLTVIAGAANLLPLPGGVLIRTQALRQRGSSYRHALAANAAAGLAWVGAGCLAVAVLMAFSSDKRLVALPLAVAAAASLGVVAVILRRVDPAGANRYLGQLVVVEAATLVFGAARVYLAFRLLGLDVNPAQAVALTASAIIASAVGIFPGGLGLREVLAGAIGSLVDLPASRAIAATAADRITTELTLGLLAGLLLFAGRRAAQAATDQSVPAELAKHPTPS